MCGAGQERPCAKQIRFVADQDIEEERSAAEASYQPEEKEEGRSALAAALRRAGLKNPDAGLEG
jgi:hypothetical protein